MVDVLMESVEMEASKENRRVWFCLEWRGLQFGADLHCLSIETRRVRTPCNSGPGDYTRTIQYIKGALNQEACRNSFVRTRRQQASKAGHWNKFGYTGLVHGDTHASEWSATIWHLECSQPNAIGIRPTCQVGEGDTNHQRVSASLHNG